jgi:hypothetical protein
MILAYATHSVNDRVGAEVERAMNLNSPTELTRVISIILAAIALLAVLTPIGGLTPNAFWLLLLAFIILLIGTFARRA